MGKKIWSSEKDVSLCTCEVGVGDPPLKLDLQPPSYFLASCSLRRSGCLKLMVADQLQHYNTERSALISQFAFTSNSVIFFLKFNHFISLIGRFLFFFTFPHVGK